MVLFRKLFGCTPSNHKLRTDSKLRKKPLKILIKMFTHICDYEKQIILKVVLTT